jgi:peptidyl-dipeptidase A
MKQSSVFLAACLLFFAVAHAQSSPPTVEEAKAFVARVNQALLASGTEASRGQWIAATDINDDTQALTAGIAARRIAQVNQFIAESHRFDSLELPPDVARQIQLLRINARPAPSEPSLRLETTTLAADLAGIYAKGKYCVDGDSRHCVGIDDLDVRVAKVRDPRELLDMWTGCHKVTLKEMTGTDHLDANPLAKYFEPLYQGLKQQNALNKSKPGWQVAANPLAGK